MTSKSPLNQNLPSNCRSFVITATRVEINWGNIYYLKSNIPGITKGQQLHFLYTTQTD